MLTCLALRRNLQSAVENHIENFQTGVLYNENHSLLNNISQQIDINLFV